MAYNEHLADRINQILKSKGVHFGEKKMMGGMAMMVDGKMCVGVIRDQLMARVGPNFYNEALTKKGAREMDFTKRPMKGFVFVDPEGWDLDTDLEYWIDVCLEFNPQAVSAKQKSGNQ